MADINITDNVGVTFLCGKESQDVDMCSHVTCGADLHGCVSIISYYRLKRQL